MKYFDQNWCGLDWTAWVTFDLKKSDWLVLPNGEGVYRIRGVGSDFLMYVGQTGRSLRGRLRYLRRNVLADLMPFNDPHTAAPNLSNHPLPEPKIHLLATGRITWHAFYKQRTDSV